MLHIGCHLSCSKGYLAMGREAESIGADTFQFFTRNPRGGSVKPFDEQDAAALAAFMRERGFANAVAHAPYTMNPCGKDEKVRDFARRAMSEDLSRLSALPQVMLNFHPGSHTGQGIETGVALITQFLNDVVPGDCRTTVLLETMAGKGSEVGGRFEELAEIISRAKCENRLGVCLDTCHVHDGGYDIVNALDDVLTAFDKTVGLSRLRAVHLNDSKNPVGSRRDRHERIGEGHIGLEAITKVICHPALAGLPFVLETPNEIEGYAQEIRLLRQIEERNRA